MSGPTSSQGSQMDVEARFAHLLNPIRDLAKNWNIDLTSNLEEYLAELGNVELVFDNGKATMNFAQAALLIQGSASVYSKKVEYLYNLAYEILKVFSNRKNNQNTADKQANADCSSSQLEADNADEFLALDDIEIDKNLEKKGDDLKNKRLSFKYLSRTPTVLMPSENSVKGDVMLYNRVGDLIGNKNDFQVNGSKIHSSGLLVIDTSLAAETINMKCTSFHVDPNKLATEYVEEKSMDEMMDAEKENCIDDVGGDNFDDDDFGTCASPLPDCGTGDAPEMRSPSLTKPDESTPRRSLRVQQAKEKKEAPASPVKNPLEPLDPYGETKSLVKPVKKLRRCLLPESLEKESEKPKRKKSKIETKIESVSEFCSLQFEKKGRNRCKAFKEFENQFWQEMNKRKEIAMKKYARKMTKDEKAKVVEECDDSDQEDAHSDGCADGMPFHDDDDCGADDDAVPDLANVLDQVGDGSSDKEAFDALKSNLPKGDDALVPSYEDLVREHVDKYMSSAGNYGQLSDLGKRVKDWEERIRPKLDAEDKHESFDIHVYGSRVLGTFETTKKEKSLSFKEICENKPQYEVCRLFLASLQLANNYNVEISTSGSLAEGVDSMELKVLSNQRHHEELQGYRAPSII